MPSDWIVVRQTMDDRPAPQCDFCGSMPMPTPSRAYPAEEFTMAVVIPGLGTRAQQYASDGWSACANCWPSVEAEDIEGLLAAFVKEHPEVKRHPEALIVPREIWRNFFAHKSGPGIDHDPDSGAPVFPG